MAHFSTKIVLLVLVLGMICSCTGTRTTEQLKKTGELRKACTTRGNPLQPVTRVNTTARVYMLRQLIRNETVIKTIALDAYLITSDDEHQTEFVDEHDKRLAYISGFSGSSAEAIVTGTKSVLWTDARYHLQADDELNCKWLLMRVGHRNVPSKETWLRKELKQGSRIGVDPKLISESKWQELKHDFSAANFTLIPISTNLIDIMWVEDRPRKRNTNVFTLKNNYAGKSWTTKVAELRDEIVRANAQAMIVTALDEIAWLLNLRARDIPYSPYVRSYLIVNMHNILFFVNDTQLIYNNIIKHFSDTFEEPKNNVSILSYGDICKELHNQAQNYKKILIPSACAYTSGASHYINECIPKEKRLKKVSPIVFMKAVKNPVEIQGMKNAHIRDAVAMCEFFSFFESSFKHGEIFTELDVVKRMNDLRFEQLHCIGNSFRTIAAYGPNGAQPHYEPTPNSNAIIYGNSTLVLDSGGQYYDGTTDVTRTIHLGIPTKEHKEAYTRVLIGNIQFSHLTFPDDMPTSVVDVLARASLWETGFDYLHGTSHGVGSFLGVHEAPIYLHYLSGSSQSTCSQLLKPGYFLSNEPAFYQEGDFGIRLENVMEVIKKPWLPDTPSHSFYGFEVVTLLPYQRSLVDLSLLSNHHRKWLNDYNQRIRTIIGPELKRQNLMGALYWMLDNTVNFPENGHDNLVNSQPILLTICAFLSVSIYYVQI